MVSNILWLVVGMDKSADMVSNTKLFCTHQSWFWEIQAKDVNKFICQRKKNIDLEEKTHLQTLDAFCKSSSFHGRTLGCSFAIFYETGTYVGKHPTPRGGEISKISKGGNIFLKIFWRGIDFSSSKGGISLTTLHQNSRIFLKFSKNIFSRGDIFR